MTVGEMLLMRTEREKMLAGELYSPADPELKDAHLRARGLCRAFNETAESEVERQAVLLGELLGTLGDQVELRTPLECDYGFNIHLGDKVYINSGAVFLDCNLITIGDYTMLGPGVHIYAADHPRDARTRATGLELAKPVTIGRHVWIGGGAIICPGVTIGDHSTIGAGSVVTKDIPANVVAAGNPCRVIRELDPSEIGP
jgi:maltose O-acetyltransferase